MTIKVEGIKGAEARLCKLATTNVEAFNRGILKAGLYLQAQSQKLVPVDTGALKASAYTRLNGGPEQKTGSDPTGFAAKVWASVKGLYRRIVGSLKPQGSTRMTFEVGYTQHYAVYVHENLTAAHPVGQAKFLEEPARKHRAKMLKIVEDEVKKAN